MKRAALIVVLLATIVVSIDWLADRTQDRPDKVVVGSRSELVIEVKVRHDRAPASLTRAQGLWAACQHTGGRHIVPPGLVEVAPGRFQVTTEPALGDHGWRRLKGCLEDMTIDRVMGSVVSKRDVS
jgi:hypothetical protein